MTDLSQQYTTDKDDLSRRSGNHNDHNDDNDDEHQIEHRLLPCRCCGVVVDPVRQEQWRWCLLGCTAISMIFSYVAVSDCTFLFLDYGESNNLFNPPMLGMFSMAVFDESGKKYGCVPQNGDERFKDGAFGAGRAFGVMTVMLETILFLVTAWILLVMRPDWALQGWKIMQCVYMVTLFCQLIMFSAFGSSVCEVSQEETFGNDQPIPSECSPGMASTLAAINVILLIALTTLICMVPAPIHPYFIRWSDDDDNDMGTDDQIDDLLDVDEDDMDHHGIDREIGDGKTGTSYWSSDDDAGFSDDSGVYDPNAISYADSSEDDLEKPRKKKKKKSKKKQKGTDDSSGVDT